MASGVGVAHKHPWTSARCSSCDFASSESHRLHFATTAQPTHAAIAIRIECHFGSRECDLATQVQNEPPCEHAMRKKRHDGCRAVGGFDCRIAPEPTARPAQEADKNHVTVKKALQKGWRSGRIRCERRLSHTQPRPLRSIAGTPATQQHFFRRARALEGSRARQGRDVERPVRPATHRPASWPTGAPIHPPAVSPIREITRPSPTHPRISQRDGRCEEYVYRSYAYVVLCSCSNSPHIQPEQAEPWAT